MYGSVKNDFGHKRGDSAKIFTSDEVMGENHYRISSRVAKKQGHPLKILSSLYYITCTWSSRYLNLL